MVRKKGRKRKDWEGKYFKLDREIANKLELLSIYLKKDETQIVEELINTLWISKFGNLDVKTASLLIKK
jgi:hypothetical protein